jgi:NADPH-dependent 2,4-dienoyl-CoA reductase/sulfur reductase-like enzyme
MSALIGAVRVLRKMPVNATGSPKVVVLGGGLAGLETAFSLAAVRDRASITMSTLPARR